MKKLLALTLFLCVSSFAFAQYNHVLTGPNGNKIEEGQYNADPGIQPGDSKETIANKMAGVHKIGTWKYWFDNGQMSSEEHYTPGGTPTGTWKTWFINGQIASQVEFSTGAAVYYHDNGQKMEEGKVNTSFQRIGTWQGWHANGNINYKGSYTNTGLKTGAWQFFDAAGKSYATQNYANGELVN